MLVKYFRASDLASIGHVCFPKWPLLLTPASRKKSPEDVLCGLTWERFLVIRGFPGGSEDNGSACNAGDLGSIPGLGRSLEKETATHSGILTWRIPWTEEPGGLQSTGSQRVRHD